MTNNIYKEIAQISYFNKFITHTSQKLYEEATTYKDEIIDKYYKEPVLKGITKTFRKNILYLIGTYINNQKIYLFPEKSIIIKHKKELFDYTFYIMKDKNKINHTNCANICINILDIYKNKLIKIYYYFNNDKIDVKKVIKGNQVSLYYKSGDKQKYMPLPLVYYDKLKTLYIGPNNILDETILQLLIRYTCFDTDKEGYFFSADNIYKFIIDNNYQDIALEAFSGSINSNLKNYCSLFTDIESKFNSKGSFFVLNTDTLKNSNYTLYICNPPFMKILIDHLLLKIMDMLNLIKNIDIMLIIPDHRSQEQADNDKNNETVIGTLTETTRLTNYIRYEGYSKYYDNLAKSNYVKNIFLLHNFAYHNYFTDKFHSIRTSTLIVYLSNNTDNTIYDKFEKYIKNINNK